MAQHGTRYDALADAPADALELLQRAHERVRRLFSELDSLRGIEDEEERQAELVDDICYELTVHSMLEEEIFYPALRGALGDDDMLDEAELDHAGIRELITQLEVMYPGDEHFDATVAVLAEEVGHHTAAEETGMFEAARASSLDLVLLAHRLAARRTELDDIGAPPDTIDAMDPHDGRRTTPRAPD